MNSSAGNQSRSFVYDRMGRLTSATLPEYGTMSGGPGTASYTYDADGNLETRTDPRNVITTNTYATLDQPWTRTFSNGTPTVTWNWTGLRQESITTGALAGLHYTKTSYTYDSIGRIETSTQATRNRNSTPEQPSVSYPFTYTYYNDNTLRSVGYPSGRVISYGVDVAARITDVSGKLGTAPTTSYVTAATWAPQGSLDTLPLGNGLTERWGYNNQLQPTQIRLGTTAAPASISQLDFYYCATQQADCVSNSGNLLGQDIRNPAGAWRQTYTYGDNANRLTAARENVLTGTVEGTLQWSEGYTYDRAGNLQWTAAANVGMVDRPVVGSYPKDPGDRLRNRAFAASVPVAERDTYYDASGNLLKHRGLYGFSYDGDNRLSSVTDNSVLRATYYYDHDGRRVRADRNGTGLSDSIFVYDSFGRLAAEYQTGPSIPAETRYFYTDHLGSTRAVTNASGSILARYDFLPFGEAVPCPGWRPSSQGYCSTADDRLQFTGKERDTESELDYFGARYLSISQGRFTSPDPLYFQEEMLGDPQRWNLHSYVRNNPLRFIDPTGQKIELTGQTEEERRKQLAAIQGAVGNEAGARLRVEQDKQSGRYFVGIAGDVSTFRSINPAASTFATIITLSEIAKFDIVGSAEPMNIGERGPSGEWRNTLMQHRAEGATGREVGTGQLWVYVKRPQEGYADVSAHKMGNWIFGGSRDLSTVTGHEFGHALGYMWQRLAGQPADGLATNPDALNLENKVRQVQKPGAQPRLLH